MYSFNLKTVKTPNIHITLQQGLLSINEIDPVEFDDESGAGNFAMPVYRVVHEEDARFIVSGRAGYKPTVMYSGTGITICCRTSAEIKGSILVVRRGNTNIVAKLFKAERSIISASKHTVIYPFMEDESTQLIRGLGLVGKKQTHCWKTYKPVMLDGTITGDEADLRIYNLKSLNLFLDMNNIG